MDIKKFARVFAGLKLAHGTYRVDGKSANGKATGKAAIVREPRTEKTWKLHLEGTRSLGIIPINEENQSVWGCIDIDQYPLDHKALVEQIRKLKLPLVVCRSKSGGAHCFLFAKKWVSAEDMQRALQQVAATLGLTGSEIFPKQIKLHLERDDVGNFLNLPYFDSEQGLRYAIKDDGTSATLEEFFGLYDQYARTAEQIKALQQEQTISGVDDPLPDGPPCLNTLSKNKVDEGSRNNALFSYGVFYKKAFPDDWQDKLLQANMLYFTSPLPLSEVNAVVKQLNTKDYMYKCSDAPINAFCNKQLCMLRKFGIGGGANNSVMANLRKYNSTPPVWFLDVNGEPLELDTDGLLSQPAFQKAAMEQLNFMPLTLTKPVWETRISSLMKEMRETESSIIEVAKDASTDGIFYDYLEEFTSHKQQARDREEILLRKPWTDDEKDRTYFRLKDLMEFLKRNKFFDYKTHQVAQRLRDIGGQSTTINVKNRTVRVYEIPAFDKMNVKIDAPDFKSEHEVPF